MLFATFCSTFNAVLFFILAMDFMFLPGSFTRRSIETYHLVKVIINHWIILLANSLLLS